MLPPFPPRTREILSHFTLGVVIVVAFIGGTVAGWMLLLQRGP